MSAQARYKQRLYSDRRVRPSPAGRDDSSEEPWGVRTFNVDLPHELDGNRPRWAWRTVSTSTAANFVEPTDRDESQKQSNLDMIMDLAPGDFSDEVCEDVGLLVVAVRCPDVQPLLLVDIADPDEVGIRLACMARAWPWHVRNIRHNRSDVCLPVARSHESVVYATVISNKCQQLDQVMSAKPTNR